MWLRLLIHYFVFTTLLRQIQCHIPVYVSTPANRVDQYCKLAEACAHDTVPICGLNGNDKRVFLDVCDLLEYACDTGIIYQHTDDQPGCPPPPSKIG